MLFLVIVDAEPYAKYYVLERSWMFLVVRACGCGISVALVLEGGMVD